MKAESLVIFSTRTDERSRSTGEPLEMILRSDGAMVLTRFASFTAGGGIIGIIVLSENEMGQMIKALKSVHSHLQRKEEMDKVAEAKPGRAKKSSES